MPSSSPLWNVLPTKANKRRIHQESLPAKSRFLLLITIELWHQHQGNHVLRTWTLLMIYSRKLPISLKVGDSLEPNTKSNINTQTQTHITINSETPNLPVPIQDTTPDHSEAICLRVQLHGNPGRGRILRDELITRRLIGLLFGFPLQHSSVRK